MLENIWLIEGLDHLGSGEFPHVFMLQQKKKATHFWKNYEFSHKTESFWCQELKDHFSSYHA